MASIGSRRSYFGLGALGRIALAALFAVASRLRYHVEVHGLEHDAGALRTYLAITHKRDMDSVAPLPAVLGHRGWRALSGDVHFAMRGDSFERGFLARIVLRPRWLSWLLRPLSVGPILRGVGVHPIDGLQFHPAESWLRDSLRAEGDASAGERLSPAFLAQLAIATGVRTDILAAFPLSRLLTWRFHAYLQGYIGPDIFAGAARRQAERRLLDSVKRQLDDLAGWLRGGGSLYSSPEGQLSSDGRISPIPAGLHRILNAAIEQKEPHTDVRVLPIVVVYDFMTVRRPRLFVDLAPAIEAAGTLPPHALAERLRAAWLACARFTCTQLASGFLRDRLRSADPPFTGEELAARVHARAVALAEAGRHVDKRLLHPATVRHVARDYLAYCARRGLVKPVGTCGEADRWLPLPEPASSLALGEPGYDTMPLAYACNELDELLGAAQLVTPASPYLLF